LVLPFWSRDLESHGGDPGILVQDLSKLIGIYV
jgi:hypothetical protein